MLTVRIGQILGGRQTTRIIFILKATRFQYNFLGLDKNPTTYGKTDVTELGRLRWDRVGPSDSRPVYHASRAAASQI
jgi:hypothetical protein